MASERQEVLDRFYFQHGPCCAGCDWWRSLNSVAGECTKSAPVSDSESWAMLGIQWHTAPPAPGHVVTTRDHHCGDFKDEFDWASLPVAYLNRVGAPPPPEME